MSPTGTQADQPAPPPAAMRFGGGADTFRLARAGAMILPALALIAAGLAAYNELVRSETEALTAALDMVAGQLSRTLGTQDVMLDALDARVEGLSWEAIDTDPALPRFIRRLAAAAPAVIDLRIVAPDGHLATGSDPAARSGEADRPLRDAVPAGAAILPSRLAAVLPAAPGGAPAVRLFRGRSGPDGRSDGGVLASTIATAAIEHCFAAAAGRTGAGFILARADGTLLARHPEPVATAERLAPGDPALLAAAMETGEAVHVTRSFSPASGLRLVAVRAIGPSGLLIAGDTGPTAVRDAWLKRTGPPALAALIAAAVLLSLSVVAERRLAAGRAGLRARAEAAEREAAEATRRAELLAQLRRTERLAALAHLSAGVAHDFNNLLQSVLISAESLTLPGLPPREVQEIGGLILRVAERGMGLTGRMLDYARGNDEPGGTTDVAASLRAVLDLLGPPAGRLRSVQAEPGAAEGLRARCRAAEFETVLINLVTNACDAMPAGGDVAIAVTGLEERRPRTETGLVAGTYLRVAVADQGTGMDAATLARAGEAFVISRPPGQGVGLGLTMARGFARRCGGKLEITSTAGQGSTVSLWLPAG